MRDSHKGTKIRALIYICSFKVHSVVPVDVKKFQTTLERKKEKKVESLMPGGNEHPQIWKPSERATTYIHALTQGEFADHQKELK